MKINNLIVVIPDGLRRTIREKQFLSNTYRKTITKAYFLAKEKNSYILLLPANKFGGEFKEEQEAAEYLLRKNFEVDKILIGLSFKKGYLDTYDNFEQVIKYESISFSGEKIKVSKFLKEGKFTLVSDELHLPRVLMIMNILNFQEVEEIFSTSAVESGLCP